MKQALRQHLLKTCSNQELIRWYDPLGLSVDKDSKQIIISFPHAFFGQWFEENIQNKFEAQLGGFLGSGYSVKYRNNGVSTRGPRTIVPEKTTKKIDFPFDSQFTFESFIINKKNYFPLASAKEVAKQRGSLFNPFIICGKNGSGKTHLLKAICNEISKKHSHEKILLASMDEINNIYSVKFSGNLFKARNHLFGYDFLFIDDFHQIQKYDSLQQEFISVFNNFYDKKKQMAFCFQDKISSYEFIDPALRSRLEWGLIVTLKRPDLEIRVNYVQTSCRLKKLPLNKEQILTLAQRFQDFRYLQGILLKLFAFRELVRREITDKDFDHILSNTEEKSTDSITPQAILSIVSENLGVSIKEIVGSKRHQQIAQARQIAMYLCRNILGLSYPALGREFGGKDHSTVLYSVKKTEELRKDDDELKRVLKELKNKCLLAAER